MQSFGSAVKALSQCPSFFRGFSLFPLIVMAQEMTQEEMMSKAIKFDELQEKLKDAVKCPVCLMTPEKGPLHQK